MTKKKKKEDPKVGTGKKPKGSDRRLYTDENPKTLLVLSLLPYRMLKKLYLKLKRLINLMLEKYKSLLYSNNEPRYLGRKNRQHLPKKQKNN